MYDESYRSEMMPSIDVRRESLKKYANTFVNTKKTTEQELDKIIQSIVEKTPEYSACAYWIFGIKQEQERLLESFK